MDNSTIGDIFDYLRNGHFINDNSNREDERIWFDYLDNPRNFEKVKAYFEQLNLILEKGNGYFYFSKQGNIQTIQSKIETAYKWIDIFDFFRTYDPIFDSGTTFELAKIKVACSEKVLLQEKLNRIEKRKMTDLEKIKQLADELVNADFAVLQPDGEQYKVLSSINYLDRLINLINIQEDATTT
jgi:hypothetical protein